MKVGHIVPGARACARDDETFTLGSADPRQRTGAAAAPRDGGATENAFWCPPSVSTASGDGGGDRMDEAHSEGAIFQ
jgi:hypothetical protein